MIDLLLLAILSLISAYVTALCNDFSYFYGFSLLIVELWSFLLKLDPNLNPVSLCPHPIRWDSVFDIFSKDSSLILSILKEMGLSRA